MNQMKNPVGVHALVWVGNTSPDEVEKAVESTKASGYDLLELSLHDFKNLDTRAAKEALVKAGVGVACSRGLAFDADVSSDDRAVVARGEKILQDSLAVTDQLGAKILTGALYSALGKYSQRLTETGRDNVVKVLRSLAQEAAGRGISLGLEICNRYETNVVNTAREALRLADDIGEDNVFIHLDTYHMNIEESNFIQPVLDVGDRLGYVHIGENHRGYLGAGSIDFSSFFQALARVEYSGPITFESFSSAIVSETLSNDLAVWRNMWDDGHDLAKRARTFIDAHVAAAANGER
ncbi:sugar phosphate isomerase/epimerase family protein [Ornithinimicrobium faecis]|uniref:sugar phosphate isomerase/epimerase family protein n=1 Tax=Ornithinimicrobium faecis TaxID=2934158 RepID=UPI0021192527|nr:sugar phosphate isomerase/epimerase [Ornithinimicrobium sp. HY1745]